MKIVVFTIFFVLALVFLLPAILGLGLRFLPYEPQPSLDSTEYIHGYQIISQQFIAKENRLAGIALSLKNPYLRNKKDLILTIYDNESPVRTVTINGSHIEDGQYVKFKFNPIIDSRDKNLKLTLAAPSSIQNESLQVWYTAHKPNWVGQLTLNEQDVPGYAVAFATLHQPASYFEPIAQIYSGWFSRLVGDSIFFAAYIAILVILIAYFIFNTSIGRKFKV